MPLSASEFRERFLLRPDVTFLNHGSFGASPRPVFEAYQRWQLELERQPVEFIARRSADLLREARRALGAYLGADGDDLVFTPNATFGVNVVARSLPLESGDEILSTDHEYGAVDRTWRFVCQRRGSILVRSPIPLALESAEQVIEAVWSRVSPRTKVLNISHVTSPTALILPIAELIRRARERGIWTVIDGAHAPGQLLDLNLDRMGADFYAGNCHKWLCAPKGAGFLHARRSAQRRLQPLVVSWGWESLAPTHSRFIDEHEYQGTRDLAPFLAIPDAIRFQRDHDWAAVQARCREIVVDAKRRMAAFFGTPPLCPDDESWIRQMAAQPLPASITPAEGAELQKRIYDRHRVEVPVSRLGDRCFLRVCVQAYNSREDIDKLMEALADCYRDPAVYG